MGLDQTDKLLLLVALAALLVVYWMVRRVSGALRRRRPIRLNPRLAQYGEPAGLTRARREQASKIVATSSTDRIVGYDIIRQVEAVLVEGFRRPEEALEGLKAAAAMKGANAVTNVHTERTAAGRCAATGDAVVVREVQGDDGEPE